jgi:hypothetical protein
MSIVHYLAAPIWYNNNPCLYVIPEGPLLQRLTRVSLSPFLLLPSVAHGLAAPI